MARSRSETGTVTTSIFQSISVLLLSVRPLDGTLHALGDEGERHLPYRRPLRRSVGDDEVLHGVRAAREAAQPIALVVGLSAQQDRPVFLTDSATASPPAGGESKEGSPRPPRRA